MPQLSAIKKKAGVIFLVVISVFFAYQIKNNWQLLSEYQWEFTFWEVFLIILFAVPLYFINVLGWHLLMHTQKIRISYWKSLRIWMFSNLGRFIPGGIWQYGGKIYLSKKEGVKTKKAIAVTILEAFFVIWTGISLTLLAQATQKISLPNQVTIILMLAFICACGAVFVISSKKLLRTLLPKKIKVIPIPFSKVPMLFFAYCLQFIFAGGVLFFVTTGVVNLSISDFFSFVSIYAISWVVGYITIFAPAGFGVQEASIAGFLTLFVPFSVGIVVSILFRLALLVAEFFTLCCVFVAIHIASKKKKSI